MKRRFFKKKIKVGLIIIFFFAVVVPAISKADFAEPLSSPPQDNLPPPVNIGIVPQMKQGRLVVGGGMNDANTGLNVYGGRVGIGIGSSFPSSKLEVGGTIKAEGFCYRNTSGGASDDICLTPGGGGGASVGGGTAGYITKWTTQSTLGNSLLFSNDTAIGLGTNVPEGLLHISDNSAAPEGRPLLKITRPQTQGTTVSQDRKNAGLYILTKDYPLNIDVYDPANPTNPIPALTVDPTGKVGIKNPNPNPTANLNVNGTIAGSNAYVGGELNTGRLYVGQGGSITLGPSIFLSDASIGTPGDGGTIPPIEKDLYVSGDTYVSGGIIAQSFCFGGGTDCLTSGGQGGVTSVKKEGSYLYLSSTKTGGKGDITLSLNISSLETYLRTLFQPHAVQNSADGTNLNYTCPSGQALGEIRFSGKYTCIPVGTGGGGDISGSGVAGRLAKFTGGAELGSSVVFEDSGLIGIGNTNLTAQLNVSSDDGQAIEARSPETATGLTGIVAVGNFGLQAISNALYPGYSGLYGEDSSYPNVTQGAGVSGVSHTANGFGVFGEAGGQGGSGGYFKFNKSGGNSGYALQTTSGSVKLGITGTDDSVGIGVDPPSWNPTSNNFTEKKTENNVIYKLKVAGAIGAREYCKEDGTGCFKLTEVTKNYWSLDSGVIYNNNRDRNDKVNKGRVSIGQTTTRVTPATNKLDVYTNNGESAAISGESNYTGDIFLGSLGAGVYGKSTGFYGRGVLGIDTSGSGVGGYFSAESDASGNTGYALQTGSGGVQFGQQGNTGMGIVGIGTEPANWTDNSSGHEKSLQLLVNGNIGADNYCDKEGNNCLSQETLGGSYWSYNSQTKGIYSNNPDNGSPGTGPVGIGLQPSATTPNKLGVFTNGSQKKAIAGESNYASSDGVGVYGKSTGASGRGVEGKATQTNGVGGYFSAETNAETTGYALRTGNGRVQLGDPSATGIVGIGAPPADWTTDSARNSLQLLVNGNVGASAYCKEDGTGCVATTRMRRGYWSPNTDTNDIFNTNSSVKVGIGTPTPRGDPSGASLDVNGKVYVNQLCIATSGSDVSVRCASTWEDIGSIMFQ